MRLHARDTRIEPAPASARRLRGLATAGALFFAFVLAGCGGTAGGSNSTAGGGGGSGGTSGLAMVVSLQDATGATITQLSAGQTATAVAVVTNGGAPVSGVVVTFTQNSGATQLVNFTPLNGSAVTDASGKAAVTVVPSGAGGGAVSMSGATSINATQVTATTAFTVGQTTSTGLQIASFLTSNQTNAITIGSYATTTFTAVVQTTAGGVPVAPTTVNFSITGGTCTGANASVSASVATTLVAGQQSASATFTDNGCASAGGQAGKALVSANLTSSNPPYPSVTVNINPPTTGSLQFLNSQPSGTAITLKGQGGAGRQTYATMTFDLVDVSGRPVPNYPVCFDATTYAGGLTVDGYNNVTPPSGVTINPVTGYVTATTPASLLSYCGSANTLGYVKNTGSDGKVVVQVNSGTQPTPVSVRAWTAYPTPTSTPLLATQSNVLIISTGLPIDHNMSMAVDTANIDGRDYDGATAQVTVSLADIFHNPVIDGTQVNFVSSGGAICTSTLGGCTTLNGTCSCTIRSQAKRPTDGRVVVMAYVIGLPNFVDSNANFLFSSPDTFDDLGNAYLDADKNGNYDSNSGVGFGAGNVAPYAPPPNPQFNDLDQCFPYVFGTQCYSSANGLGTPINTYPYTALTPTGAPAQLSTGYGPVYLRRSLVVFFSGGSGGIPTVVVPRSFTGVIAAPQIVLQGNAGTTCASPAPTASPTFVLMDGYGNPMAAGTTLSIPTPSGVSASIVTGTPVPVVNPHIPNPINDNNAAWGNNSTGNNNVPKTSIAVSTGDPTLFATGIGVNVTGSGSCTSGSSGSFQILVTSPHGAQQAACVLYEGLAGDANLQGTCPRNSITVHYN